MYLSILKI